MSEDCSFTCNIKMICDKGVTPFPLNLAPNHDPVWGKCIKEPEPQMNPTEKGTVYTFHCVGAKGTATGTQGMVGYASIDNPANPTTFTISYDVPYSASNSASTSVVSVTNNYKVIVTKNVPEHGNNCVYDITIQQIGPKS